jgi:hypothetical protein
LSRIAGNAAYAGALQHYRIEALAKLQCSLTVACLGSALVI